jgi:hypothetical protein
MTRSTADQNVATDNHVAPDLTTEASNSGRSRGLVAAFGALATMVGSACGSSNGAAQPTDTIKPPSTSATVETSTPATTIDTTTTISVETTTTDAPTTSSAPTTTEIPTTTTTIDLAELAIPPATLGLIDIGQRYTAYTYLRAGADPVVNADGTVTFTVKRPMVQANATEYPAGVIDRVGQPFKTILDVVIARITSDKPDNYVINIDPDSPIVFFGDTQREMERLAADPSYVNDEYYASWATYWGDGTNYAGVAACGTQTFVDDDNVVYTNRVIAEFQVSQAPDGQWYIVQDGIQSYEGYPADQRPAIELDCFSDQ